MIKPAEQREKESKALVDTKWIYKGRVIQLKVETYKFENGTKLTEIILSLSPKEAKHLIEQNKIRDAKTVAGILRYLCPNGG